MKALHITRPTPVFWITIFVAYPVFLYSTKILFDLNYTGLGVLFLFVTLVGFPGMIMRDISLYDKAYYIEFTGHILSSASLLFFEKAGPIVLVGLSSSIYVALRGLMIILVTSDLRVRYFIFLNLAINIIAALWDSITNIAVERQEHTDLVLQIAIAMPVVAMIIVFFNHITMQIKNKNSQYSLAQEEVLWYANLFNMASHNLRTPLTNLTSSLELLKLKHPEIVTQSASILSRADDSSQRILKTINTFVKPAKHGKSGSLEEALRGMLGDFDGVVLVPPPKEAQPHQAEMTALLLSVDVYVSNAFDHGNATEVVVDLSDYPKSILVSDNGAGMSTDKIKKFGTPQSSKIGNGLGTFFAKSLLLHAGYEPFAENRTDSGVVIKIRSKRAS